jgi:hypothetical protein
MLMPHYWETVVIGWRILWQGVGSFLLALFFANVAVLSFLPELTRSGPSVWALVFPLLAVTTLSLFVLMPLVVWTLVMKPFRTFHLEFVRDEPSPPHSFENSVPTSAKKREEKRRRSPYDTHNQCLGVRSNVGGPPGGDCGRS